jgi:hypothetical protein
MGLPNSGAMLPAPLDTKQVQAAAVEIYITRSGDRVSDKPMADKRRYLCKIRRFGKSLVITLLPGRRGARASRVLAEFRTDGKVAALRHSQGDFSRPGNPTNGCIFRNIRHNWPGGKRESHENADGEGTQVRRGPADPPCPRRVDDGNRLGSGVECVGQLPAGRLRLCLTPSLIIQY